MAVRSWRAGPDEIRRLSSGEEVGVLSRQGQFDAIMDAINACDRLGGTIGVIYGRRPTGFPGEMVTTGIIVNWQDRTDARPQHEEPVAFEPGEGVALDFEDGAALEAGADEPV